MVMTWERVCLILAVVCFLVYCLAGFGALGLEHSAGWLGGGLALFAAGHL